MWRNWTLLLLWASLSSPVLAEKDVALKPSVTTVKELLVSESFEQPKLNQHFRGVKGEWTVVEGELHGKELKADKHAAVLNYQHPNRDSVIRFSFQLADADALHLSLNHAKGHLYRVIIAENSVKLQLDKDKKDPKSRAILLSEVTGTLAKDKWHTMLVEMKGDLVSVKLDNEMVLGANHPSLNTDKPNYRFIVRGNAVKLDDLHIWSVE